MTADEKIATRNAFQAKPHFHKLVGSSGKCCGSVEICWLIVGCFYSEKGAESCGC